VEWQDVFFLKSKVHYKGERRLEGLIDVVDVR
jgi:hypothetical protein